MKKISIAVVLLAIAAAFGFKVFFSDSGVKDSMKELKKTYAAAMSSTNMTEFAKQAALLQTAAQNASKQDYDGSKPNEVVYRAGMMELGQEMSDLNQAIAANDLSKAKSILARVNDSKKKYHTALGE